jgi:hypothetical protein
VTKALGQQRILRSKLREAHSAVVVCIGELRGWDEEELGEILRARTNTTKMQGFSPHAMPTQVSTL